MTSLDGLKAFLKKYDQVVESRKSNTDICASEFQAIKLQSAEDKKELLALEGSKEPNKKKNRYKDILPYDYTRVVLQKDNKFVDCADYINANHVEVEYGQRAYIAAQGPMPHTVDDFWRMIWQYKIKVVVMGCKEVEMGKNRCYRYWAEPKEEAWFHDIKVTLVESKSCTHNMMLRELKAEKHGATHYLTQLHYMDWPDHGAPETTETILQLIHLLREKHPSYEPPVLIHCSAGCGRTGAIIATDIGKKMIQAHEKNIDILTIVSRLRKQRPALVQSKEQYEFIYEVFREMVTQEIQRYESQFNSDYMNINAFPVLKSDHPTISPKCDIPPPKPDLHPLKADHPPPKPDLPPQKPDFPPQKPDFPPQKPDLPPESSRPDKDKKKHPYINNELITDERRQIILPQEHVVNTDSGFIRRSRSAYGKKPKPGETKISSHAPPEVPLKENKHLAQSRENLDSEGPVLPPKSPNSLAKQKFFQKGPSRSVKVRGNIPAVRPKLLKKPSIDSMLPQKKNPEPDYIQLEGPSGGFTLEDFIPAPTPVGFSQYPMRSKMSHSSTQPMIPNPIKTDLKVKSSSNNPLIHNDDIVNRQNGSNSPGKSSSPSHKLNPSTPPSNSDGVVLQRQGTEINFFYSPDHENEKVSSGIFGSASSSFDTSVVRSSPNTLNVKTVDEYAIVDLSKKTNRVNKENVPKEAGNKVNGFPREPPKQTVIYETLSGGPAVIAPSNKYMGKYAEVDTIGNVKIPVTDVTMEKSREVQPIKPYTVTEVGFGHKKKTDRDQERKVIASKEIQHIPVKTDGPPIPNRNLSLFPSVSDESDYADVNIIYPQTEVDTQPGKISAAGGINWINDKFKILSKRVSNPAIPVDVNWSQSFDIAEYGFPNRINAKPSGPRPRPSNWKEIPTP